MSNLFTRAIVLKRYLPKLWRIYWLGFVALFIASFATAVIAQPQAESLSLQNALHLAEQRSQALLAQDAAAQASQELAIEAGQLPDPMLELS
ncbi:MAG: transporter, partial [Methylophaga sp.]|nr:transporter [Methylophaga sp.]